VTHTVVFFHAHPDDEAMLTAGTMAKLAAQGHRVVLVLATRGEVGLAADDLTGDGNLGELRTAEALASADALGVSRVEFLDYLDSGSDRRASDGSTPMPGTFCATPVGEAAQRLAEILRAEQADVLTTYDPLGGYGHPDHVRVHEVGAAAAVLANTPVVLEATISRGLLQMALDLLPTLGYEVPADFAPPDLATVYTDDADLTHAIDVSEHLAAKRASMLAHTSQTTSSGSDGPTGTGTTTRTLALFLQIPEDLFGLAFGTEWYVDRAVEPGNGLNDVFATWSTSAKD
jgi:LmbE family N-acetylglucosaminyl deacetylase